MAQVVFGVAPRQEGGMHEQTEDSDKLEQMLVEERNKRLLMFSPMIEAERQPGSFSSRYATRQCGIPASEVELFVQQVCDNVIDAILNGSGPLSVDTFRAYLKISVNHEAPRWKRAQQRMVSIETTPLELANAPEPLAAVSLPSNPLVVLKNFLNVFVERLLPPDGPHDAGAVRPIGPALCSVMLEYVAQQTRDDALSLQERSLRRAVSFAASEFGLSPQEKEALQRKAYRRFEEAKKQAFEAVPDARSLIEKFFPGGITPSRLGKVFGYIWQGETETEQGDSLPLTLTARRS
jgi:hypothetical protein